MKVFWNSTANSSADRDGFDGAQALWSEVRAVEAELGERGRVLVRRSGTEPVVRVMVEAPTAEQAERAVARLCEAVAASLGKATP